MVQIKAVEEFSFHPPSPLGDPLSFTSLSRRHRAALIAPNTEAEESASAR